MTDLGEIDPDDGRGDKPPKRNWEAIRKDKWFDLKLSHYVEVGLTAVLVWIGYLQYKVYTRQAGIMQQQADISENDQRPWVRPKLNGISDIEITSDKLKFSIAIQFENIGKSPAMNVHGYQGIYKGDGNLIPEHDAFCQKMEAGGAASKNPVVVFPAETTTLVINPLEGDPSKFLISLPNSPGFLAIEILGCVVYKSNTDSKWHHTWYSWRVLRSQNGSIGAIQAGPQTVPFREITTSGGGGQLSAGRNYAN